MNGIVARNAYNPVTLLLIYCALITVQKKRKCMNFIKYNKFEPINKDTLQLPCNSVCVKNASILFLF